MVKQFQPSALQTFRLVETRAAVSVVGLGYVGAVSTACLADLGHRVVGVDVDPLKVAAIAAGESPIHEDGLADLLGQGVADGLITATADIARAVAETDVTFLSVGTPTAPDGGCDDRHIRAAARGIGLGLAAKRDYHVVVMRCSIPPGTTMKVMVPAIEAASGKVAGLDFGVAFNPEFLREGVAVEDFRKPPKTVIGASDERAATILARIFEPVDANPIVTSIEVAEMVKYVDNVWHATKVAFANEIGNIAQAVGVDSWEVMDIFCQDTKLNISPYYMKPGFAFGGSCLPKDVRALTSRGRELDLDLPLLNALIPTNEAQVDRAVEMVADFGIRNIAFLGISFKSGTDDLRESPQVTLVERLIGKGFNLRVYDKNVHLARLLGANRAYIEGVIPHIGDILSDDMGAVLEHGDLVIVGNPAPEFRLLADRLGPRHRVLDLARIPGLSAQIGERYRGINW